MVDPREGSQSFGELAAKTGSPDELLKLEHAHGRGEASSALDELVGELTTRLLLGETPFSLEGIDETDARRGTATLRLSGLTEAQERLVEENFSLERQQSRGSWSLPETVRVKLGLLHFPSHLRRASKFFHDAVESDLSASVSTAASPEATLVHVLLDPLLSMFYEPFALRSGRALPANRGNRPDAREKGSETRRWRWHAAEDFLSALGLDVEEQLSVLRPGSGWSRLRAADQLAAKVALGEAIRREVERTHPLVLGARYRAFRCKTVLERYYAKADKKGRALRRRVLTKELERTLSAFFGGDWLTFLDYVGEEPHPEEHVATALPQTRLYLGLSREAPAELGAEGVSEEQLELIAASLYGGRSSPAQVRIRALKRYWESFDEVHARQRSGMESLWGFVEEWRRFSLGRTREPDGAYSDGIYRRLLPPELLEEIERLWGAVMLSREPGRMVTEPFPHVMMAETFGPALRFWQGCALTAWFLCEGPYSRTDMAGLEHYHRRELAELEDLGTPVDRSMFAELVVAEGRLGPPEPTHVETRETEIEPGLTFTSTISHGSRREGFETLRDVITKYRREWAERHLDAYLKARVEGDVRYVVEHYHKKMAERGGKPPTVKQFAKVAQGPTNRWFGGDVAALYRTFGERASVSPERVRRVPTDAKAFVRRVYSAIGGVEVGPYPDNYAGYEEHSRKIRENYDKSELANMALDYLQLEEVLGTPPTLQQLGKGKFAYRAEEIFGVEVEEAWTRYERIIRGALEHESREVPGNAAVLESDRGGAEQRANERTGTLGRAVRNEAMENPAEPTATTPGSAMLAPGDGERQEAPAPRPWWRRLLGS